MGIDESAGIKDRKDKIMRSAEQSRCMAILLMNTSHSLRGMHPNVIGGIIARGWAEKRAAPTDKRPYGIRYHITDAGRQAAESSTAVKEWLEDWKRNLTAEESS